MNEEKMNWCGPPYNDMVDNIKTKTNTLRVADKQKPGSFNTAELGC